MSCDPYSLGEHGSNSVQSCIHSEEHQPSPDLAACKPQHGMLVFSHVSAPAVNVHPTYLCYNMELQCMLMQALLSQYVALHHEHSSMLSQLLDQLRQYGYQAEYKGPLAMEPMQLLGITQPQQAR